MNKTLIIYKILDWLKQESPFWWAVVQSLLWGSFTLISSDWVNFKGEEVVIVFLGGLISGVGTRTTKKLSESKESVSVNPDKFKQGFEDKLKEIQTPVELKKEIKIVQKFLPKGQWIEEKVNKNQIVLHHSVSSSVDSLYNWWSTDKSRIGTAYSIDKDGTIYQHFPDDEWAYHLYISAKGNNISKGLKRFSVTRDRESIGIELVNAGGLTLKDGKWYSSFGTVIPEENVYKTNYRGFKGFEKYTTEQIASLKNLIEHLSEKYNIPFTVPTFDVQEDALKGKKGIWPHTAYRSDKSDVYDYPELVFMLKELKDNAKT